MNLLENLGIKKVSVTADKTIISVSVTDKLKQPFGLVHGGINAVLAETAASLGANEWLKENIPGQICVGMNINTEHLRPVKIGEIRAIAQSLKTGRKFQTWQVNLYNFDKLTSTSMITLANIEKP